MFLSLSTRVADFLKSAGSYFYELALTLGGPGLFLVAFADSSFLSIPQGNDLLIVVLSIGQSWEAMSYFVLMTVLGSVAGSTVLYGVGRRGTQFVHRRLSREKLQEIHRLYSRFGIWSIAVPAILPPPTPFKLFVLSAGVFKVPILRFALAVGLGRTIRYFTYGVLAVLYGETTRRYLEENLEGVGAVLFLIFLVLGLVYTVHWYRVRRRVSGGEVV